MALVFVVEDEPTIQMVLDLSLSGEGHEVETFDNGCDAAERLDHYPRPDILIADLNIPGLSGDSLAELVNSDPDMRSIPFILITGCIPESSALQSEHYDIILEKPFKLEEINTHVKLLTERVDV